MYTGFVLWILGWSTYHGAIVSLAIGLVGIANILYWRRLEEARLLATVWRYISAVIRPDNLDLKNLQMLSYPFSSDLDKK